MKNPLLSFALAAAIFAISSGNVAQAAALADFYIPAEVKSVHSYVSADSTNIKVNTIVKGFASNDPYFPKTVNVPKVGFFQFARSSMGSLVKTNAWWLAFSIAAGYMMTDDGPMIQGTYFNAGDYYDRGNCNNGFLQNANFSQCEAFNQSAAGFDRWVSPGWYKCVGSTHHQGFCGGQSPIKFYRILSRNGSSGYAAIMEFPAGTDLQPKAVPVPQQKLENDFLTVCASNPLDCAKAFQNPNGVPYPELFPPLKYLPNVNPADEPFLNCYFSGQLQTSNPSGSCYATQETYDRIKQLAADLIKSQTPEGQADAANQANKNPLTQPQLEETMRKQDAEVKAALGEKPAFDKLTDPIDKFVENVNKTPQDEINPLPQNTFGIAGSGTCYLIQKPISIMGVTVDMSTRSFCEAYYYPYFLPILTWFFYIATGLYIWFSLRDAYSRRI